MQKVQIISIRRSFRKILLVVPLVAAGATGCTMGTTGSCGSTVTTTFEVMAAPDASVMIAMPGMDGGVSCTEACSDRLDNVQNCAFGSGDAGQPVVTCTGTNICLGGRRTQGLHNAADATCASDVGRYFARLAHLEAASIHSFGRLVRELRALGAPSALLDAARRAAADEVRHARDTAAIARRFGADVEKPRIARSPNRSLVEVASENAAEGCVAETYAALTAHHQAAHAADEEIASTLRGIAEDETRHAELAWEVHAWARTQLSDDENATVHAAAQRAVDELRLGLDVQTPTELAHVAGVPTSTAAHHLWNGLRSELWAQV